MHLEQMISDVLDQTIQALIVLDLDKLQALERRMVGFADSKTVFDRDYCAALLAKKRLLEVTLQNSKSNLDALNRLHRRNTRQPWEH